MKISKKRREVDNFRKWRENARKSGLIPNSSVPLKQDIHLAFLIGLILGDGHLEKGARTQALRITLGTDKPLLWQYAASVVEKVFNKKPSVRFRKQSACLNLDLYQNNLSNRLEIPLGARKLLPIKLPRWIWANDEFLKMALKGLFEAEGSLSIHLPTYTYNMAFSNTNVSLLNEVQNALIKFGYHPKRRLKAVRLRKKAEVDKFSDFITFRKYLLI